MSNYKYKFGNGLAFLEKKDLQMMEEMAHKGYVPVGANALGFYKFAPAQAEEVDYSMDISTIKEKSDGFKDYKDIFESSGWSHVFSLDNIHFFKAPKGTTPIYTDQPNEAEKYRHLGLISLKGTVGALLLAVVFYFLFSMVDIRPLRIIFSMLMGACLGYAVAMTFGTLLNMVRTAKRQ